MTLIAGLNLSNRLYLISDTRVTFSSTNTFRDDVKKIVNIHGPGIGQRGLAPDGNSIAVAVAGRVDFANFFTQKVKYAIKSNILSSDILILRDQIELFSKDVVNEWFLDPKNTHRVGDFIFGGMTNNRKKKIINLTKLKLTLDRYVQILIKKVELENPEKKSFCENLSIPRPIQECIENSRNTLNVADSHIFLLRVDTKKGITVKVAEWGQYVSAGCYTLTKNDISEDLISLLEFDVQTHGYKDQGKLIGDIWWKIFSNDLKGGIGGAVVTQIIDEQEESKVIVSNSHTDQKGNIFLNVHGKNVKLLDLNEYMHKGRYSDATL